MATESPDESKSEEGVEKAEPNLAFFSLRHCIWLVDELLKEVAEVLHDLYWFASHLLLISIGLQLGESLVDILLK